jgi:hypothetical protein
MVRERWSIVFRVFSHSKHEIDGPIVVLVDLISGNAKFLNDV